MKRREMIKYGMSVAASTKFLGVAALVEFLSAPVHAEATKELRVLTWEGYADDAWVRAFEKQTNCRVKVSYTGSVDEIFAKMAATKGADFDVIAVETSSYRALVKQKLIQPLNQSKLPNLINLTPAFRNVPAVVFDSKLYAVPFTWGSNALIYDKKIFATAPGWEIFWDPKYSGRVLGLDDATTMIVTTALVLGIKDPFNLTDDQFNAVKIKMIEQKKQILSYYAGYDDGVSTMAQGGVVAMMSMGEPQVAQLKAKGMDCAIAIPKQGAIGWIDCHTISAGARNPDLAHAYINFMMDKRVGKYVSEKTNYGNTTDQSANDKLGYNYENRLIFLQAPESQTRRIALWNEVKATRVR
jgi:spermidine/putrescine-binding protein